MTPDQFARIKQLHEEFETMGMMHEDWGVMAHEHRAKLIARVEELERGLQESVELQSHYAGLLNAYDGGERMQFNTVEWLQRLAKRRA